MQRTYLIVLIVSGGIFLFAVGFYAISDSESGGRTAAPPRDAAELTDADGSPEPADAEPGDEAAPPPRRSLADRPDDTRTSPRTDANGSSGSRDEPREDVDDRDTAGSVLDRLKSTVDQANRDDASTAPADRDPDETTAASGETGRPAARRDRGEPDTDRPAPPTVTLGGSSEASEDTRGASAGGTDSTDAVEAADAAADEDDDEDVRRSASTDSRADRRSPAKSIPGPSTGTASETASEAPDSPSDRNYVVQPGDTLEGIAVELYGDAVYWDEIAQANPLVDPRKLRVGQEIRLPRREAIEGEGRDEDEDEVQVVAPGEVVRYTVRPGDTLSTIARAYYGQASRWRYLYNVNRNTIGANPNALQAGDVLEIPPFPEVAE